MTLISLCAKNVHFEIHLLFLYSLHEAQYPSKTVSFPYFFIRCIVALCTWCLSPDASHIKRLDTWIYVCYLYESIFCHWKLKKYHKFEIRIFILCLALLCKMVVICMHYAYSIFIYFSIMYFNKMIVYFH